MNDLFELFKNHFKIRLSQLKTLYDLAKSLIKCGTIGIASIGRSIESDALEKHRIKRVDRFVGNSRINRLAVSAGLAEFFCKKRKRVYVCIDWTDGTDKVHDVLEATIPIHSRGILIHTRVHRKDELQGNQNRLEAEFLEDLRKIFPEDVKVVILADRGFGKVVFFKKLKELGFDHIVRVTMGNWIHSRSYAGLIENVKIKSSLRKDYGKVLFTKEHRWSCRLVGIYEPEQEEPWFLVTNTNYRFRSVVNAYARRFEIEETNRDIKNERNGLRLRGVKFKTAARLERMLSLVSVAYALMVVAGDYGERRGIHRRLMANTSRERTLALWRIGQYVLLHVRLEVMKLQKIAAALPVV